MNEPSKLYPEITKIKHLEPRHIVDEAYMNKPHLMLFHREQKITRIPPELKISPAQHLILGKIYKYQQWHNQGPYLPELDTHPKSIKVLIEKGMVKYIDKRIVLQDLGYAALCFQLLHIEYKRDLYTMAFEAQRIQDGLLDPSEAQSTQRVKKAQARTPIAEDEYNKERLMISALDVLFYNTSPQELAYRTKDPRGVACRLAIMFNKPKIEALVRRLKIQDVAVQHDERHLVKLSIRWFVLPYRNPNVTIYEVK